MADTLDAVVDLELMRVPGDRRRYELAGVGTLRLEGLFSRSATADAGGARWTLAHRGFWQRELEAVDELGSVVGEFFPRSIRRGGTLRWGTRALMLNPASSWRERYVLEDAGRELALLDGKGWGRRPVRLTLHDRTLESALLLFAAFVVRDLADDASSAGGAVAATTASC